MLFAATGTAATGTANSFASHADPKALPPLRGKTNMALAGVGSEYVQLCVSSGVARRGARHDAI